MFKECLFTLIIIVCVLGLWGICLSAFDGEGNIIFLGAIFSFFIFQSLREAIFCSNKGSVSKESITTIKNQINSEHVNSIEKGFNKNKEIKVDHNKNSNEVNDNNDKSTTSLRHDNFELVLACWKGEIDRVKELIKKCKNPNFECLVAALGGKMSPIKASCQCYYKDVYAYRKIMEILINSGATNINDAIDVCIIASVNCDYNTINYLISNGIDINLSPQKPVRDPKLAIRYHRSNALGTAVKFGNIDFIKFLIYKGADVNYNNGEPLIRAVRRALEIEEYHTQFGIKTVELLLKKGANPNAGCLLCEVAKNHKFKVASIYASLLLKYGADPYLEDYNSERAFDCALESGNLDIIDLIEEYDKNREKRIKESINRIDFSTWGTINGLPFYFFYYYFPKRYTNVTFESLMHRSTIYAFKDGVECEEVISVLYSKLMDTFGTECKHLTFVCIPASTEATTKKRLEKFSEKICSATGMTNAYDHVTIEKEKTPKHLGGNDEAIYHFSAEFLKNKYIVLFDDVVTSGRSMQKVINKLKSINAKVVCQISIAMTYNERSKFDPIHPFTGKNGLSQSDDYEDIPF